VQVTDPDALQQFRGTLSHLAIQLERVIDAIRQQHIVEHIEILEQFELLEHQTNVPDAEVAYGTIVESSQLLAGRDNIA
jgi:hypothetical protein